MIHSEIYHQLDTLFDIFEKSNGLIRPHFILTGPSGSGKSYTIQELANKRDINLLEINAAQLTKEGTSGNSLSKALSPIMMLPANQLTIVFVDEFDKLFINGNMNSSLANEVTVGVQNEFLKVIESGRASVFGDYGKYVTVPTDKILFCFAGAFNGEKDISLDRLREFGVKTEFLGRVGLLYQTEEISLADIIKAMQESELLKHYLELFEDADRDTVEKAMCVELTKAYENNTLGYRIITTLLHQYFIKGGFPENETKKITFQTKLSITRQRTRT